MIEIKGSVSPNIKKKFRNRFEKFEWRAGLFEEDWNKPHFPARSIYTKTGKRKKKKSAFTTVDGLKARKKGTVRSVANSSAIGPVRLPTMRQILHKANHTARKDIIKAPFEKRGTLAMWKLRRAIVGFLMAERPGGKHRKRVDAALVNVIRDPIRRRAYGKNSREWAKEKGFNRLLFDTGQLWKAIKSKVVRKSTIV